MAPSQQARSYAAAAGPDGVEERNAFTCAHCQRIVHVRPRQDPASLGGVCKSCMGLVCPRCHGRVVSGDGCTIWEKQMDAMERRFERHRAVAAWGLPR